LGWVALFAVLVSDTALKDGARAAEFQRKNEIKESLSPHADVLELKIVKSYKLLKSKIDKSQDTGELELTLGICRRILYRIIDKLFTFKGSPESYLILMRTLGLSKFLRKVGVEVLVCPAPNNWLSKFAGSCIVGSVWDLGHLDYAHFLEFKKENYIKNRNFNLSLTLSVSSALVTESESLSTSLRQLQNAAEKSISSIPFLPIINLPTTQCSNGGLINLPKSFVFYPAANWEHKNHIVLFEALSALIAQGKNVKHLVLAGKNTSTLLHLVKKFSLNDYVHILGRVSSKELAICYSRCSALVMPSFIGPTNLPPLEGLQYGKIVYISNRHFFDDRLMKFMIVKDPNDSSDWTECFTSNLKPDSRRIEEIDDVFDQIKMENRKKWQNICLSLKSQKSV
jgi:glycosyltransferase involved in cell wall biosynthesis